MAAEAAALLDELMGRNRNAHPNENVRSIKWDDEQVCRSFLCGYCPNELFTNTKADLGPCPLIHDDPLRKEYQESSRFEKMGYEEAWIESLEAIVSDVDKKIKRGLERLSMTQGKGSPPPGVSGPKQAQINTLTEKIDDLVVKAEMLGNEGKVEEAQGMMKLCEQLKKERQQLESASIDKQDNSQQAKQMEVCPICGAFLIVGDAESRQKEHLMGKQHMGYAQIRATCEDFKEKKRQKVAAQKAEMEKRREEERRRRDDRDRGRSDRGRSRNERERRRNSRERRLSRDRDRDRRRRSRSQEKRRSRSRDRRRSRSRDKSRRSRSRDRKDREKRDERRTSRGSSRDKDRKDRERKDRDEKRAGSRDKENTSGQTRNQAGEKGSEKENGRNGINEGTDNDTQDSQYTENTSSPKRENQMNDNSQDSTQTQD